MFRVFVLEKLGVFSIFFRGVGLFLSGFMFKVTGRFFFSLKVLGFFIVFSLVFWDRRKRKVEWKINEEVFDIVVCNVLVFLGILGIDISFNFVYIFRWFYGVR